MRRVAIVLSIFGLLTVAGCSGSVNGQISSKSAQKPVPAATVQVGDQKVVTDTSGRFTIGKVGAGGRAVTVTAGGFGPYTSRLTVQRGTNTLNVALLDGTVQGALKENAEVREPIAKAKVTIAGKPASVARGGRFTATGIPVGTQTVVVTAPGQPTYTKQVVIAPGANTVDAVLNLTPVETYMRYYLAYRFNRFHDAYLMLHPDVKKHYSYKKFVKDMKSQITLGIKIFGTHTMAKWHPAYAHKTYHGVVAIDRAYTYRDAYGTATENYTQHWQQVNGRWYIIFDWRS